MLQLPRNVPASNICAQIAIHFELQNILGIDVRLVMPSLNLYFHVVSYHLSRAISTLILTVQLQSKIMQVLHRGTGHQIWQTGVGGFRASQKWCH